MPNPGNPYTAQLDDLYNQIMNHNNFQYDMNGDMLYQNYKDQYINNGRQAMVDTMGQANAMTGGYGNSYSAVAGNQAYQQYLGQLNSVVPQLEARAYDRWNDELSRLYNQYQLAGSKASEWDAANPAAGGVIKPTTVPGTAARSGAARIGTGWAGLSGSDDSGGKITIAGSGQSGSNTPTVTTGTGAKDGNAKTGTDSYGYELLKQKGR